jgi:hypothetical protein
MLREILSARYLKLGDDIHLSMMSDAASILTALCIKASRASPWGRVSAAFFASFMSNPMAQKHDVLMNIPSGSRQTSAQ